MHGYRPSSYIEDLRGLLTPIPHSNWDAYLHSGESEANGFAKDVCPMKSYAFTAWKALQQLPENIKLNSLCGRCVMWVLGARDHVEKQQILDGHWEPLFSAIPVSWDIVLVGPEMSLDVRVYGKPGRRIYIYACEFHKASLRDHLQNPSFICIFNSGIGAMAIHARYMALNPWAPTLGQLLMLGRPVLMTCPNDQEAMFEEQVFEAMHACHIGFRKSGFGIRNTRALDEPNSCFTWLDGTSLSSLQLERGAVPHIEAQLCSIELLLFLSRDLRLCHAGTITQF